MAATETDEGAQWSSRSTAARWTIAGRPEAASSSCSARTVGLRSMKDGCAPEGSCGACTVIVDGRAVVSCAQPADARRRPVRGRPWRAVARGTRGSGPTPSWPTGASQCGFCSPGIVMKAEALLARDTRADRARRSPGRSPATSAAAPATHDRRRDRARRGAHAATGTPGSRRRTGAASSARRTARYEGRELALGEQAVRRRPDRVPGMLHGALRFADHPRAVVRRIDVVARPPPTRASSRSSTAADVPGERDQGLIRADWPVFVAEGETTRYVGDVLAAVAATTRRGRPRGGGPHRGRRTTSCRRSPIRSRRWPADAPAVHAGGNLLSPSVVRRGDVDAALAGAAHVATETFRPRPDRARLPRAGGLPRGAPPTPTRRRRARRGPLCTRRARAPGRTAARSRRCWASSPARSGSPRSPTGGGVRRQGGPQRPGPGGAAGLRDRAARPARPQPRARACASTPSAIRSGWTTRSAATRTAASSRSGPGSSATTAPTPASG